MSPLTGAVGAWGPCGSARFSSVGTASRLTFLGVVLAYRLRHWTRSPTESSSTGTWGILTSPDSMLSISGKSETTQGNMRSLRSVPSMKMGVAEKS